MSQEKVNRYKEYKKNKDKILKKEKQMRKLEAGIAAVVAAAFVAWFGWSIYNSATAVPETATEAAEPVVIGADAYSHYIADLQTSFSA